MAHGPYGPVPFRAVPSTGPCRAMPGQPVAHLYLSLRNQLVRLINQNFTIIQQYFSLTINQYEHQLLLHPAEQGLILACLGVV